jgi:adenylate kinase family enzyme
MKKVAVFGNAGGGKSTLSKKLSEILGLPLHVLDKIQYRSNGVAVPTAEYQHIHAQILATDRWIIDGFGCMETLWLRLDAADRLVFIDLPLYLHFWWVTNAKNTQQLCSNIPTAKPVTRTELFFGLRKPNGTEVNNAEFQRFLNREVTPRFPDGFTVIPGQGQFKDARGAILQERSKLSTQHRCDR